MANQDIIDELQRSIEITRDARFRANLRLAQRNKMSGYVVALLSTYVILLSLIPNFHPGDPQKAQILLSCSILVSVFIIFTSLLDSSSNYYHKGELLHQSARGVANVYYDSRLLDANSASFLADLDSVRKEYKKVLEECPFNHDDLDYKFVRLRRPDLFPRHYATNSFLYGLQRIMDYMAYYLRLYAWLYPHAIVLALVSYVVFRFVF